MVLFSHRSLYFPALFLPTASLALAPPDSACRFPRLVHQVAGFQMAEDSSIAQERHDMTSANERIALTMLSGSFEYDSEDSLTVLRGYL